MKFEQALQAMREGKKVSFNWHLPCFYYIKNGCIMQEQNNGRPSKLYNLGVADFILEESWFVVKIENNGTISKDEFETACFEKVKPETAYWEKCGYIHKDESFLITATCSKCNNCKEFEGRKTENGVIDFDYTKIDAFCSVCGAEMSNAEQPKKKNHLEKAFEECADQLKQEAVKMVAEPPRKLVIEADVSLHEFLMKLQNQNFELSNRICNQQKQIEELQKAVDRLTAKSRYGF